MEASGQFSIRGGIIDIFPLTEENPWRIELWGDEIDSIRSFDVESQRSVENLTEIRLYPASEIILDEGRIQEGLKKIKKEAKTCESRLREQFKTEEAARLSGHVKDSASRWRNFMIFPERKIIFITSMTMPSASWTIFLRKTR